MVKHHANASNKFSLEKIYQKNLKKHIHTLQSLVGVTQTDFQSIYLNTLKRLIAYYIDSHLITDQNDIGLQDILEKVILALKRRQGYLLPRGADSETAFREQEAWTFAVFSAALLLPIATQLRWKVVEQVLAEKNFQWLSRHRLLFALWQDYLQEDAGKNIFSEIISFASEKDTLPLKGRLDRSSIDEAKKIEQERAIQSTEIEAVSIKPENRNELKNFYQQENANKKSNNINYEPPKNAIIEEIDLATLSQDNVTAVSQEEKQNNTTQSCPIVTLPLFKAKHFWEWLKRAIVNHEITINAPESSVHGVNEGIFICLPGVIEKFLLFKAKEQGIDVKEITSLQQAPLIKAIKQHEALVRNNRHSRIHTYSLNVNNEQHVLSGVVIKPEALLGKETVLPINEALVHIK